MPDIYAVVKRPLVTESVMQGLDKTNTYVFEVHPSANKVQIRGAIEKIYSVRVVDVRTAVVHGKRRRTGRIMGTTRHWKKAIVKLHPDDHIDLF